MSYQLLYPFFAFVHGCGRSSAEKREIEIDEKKRDEDEEEVLRVTRQAFKTDCDKKYRRFRKLLYNGLINLFFNSRL